MANPISVPGTVVPSGAAISPGGAQGVQGIQGLPGTLPVGTVILYVAGGTPPASWMACDGSAISRATYPDLFAAIGTTYGTGDGSTTFNLPDLRGRTVVGVGQGAGLTNRVLAATGGEETHKLVVTEMPSHTHGGVFYTPGGPGVFQSGGATMQTASVTATGGDGAHNTMPPFLALFYIIKVSVSGGATAQAPIADTTQPGLMRTVSGNTTDFIDGTNNSQPLAPTIWSVRLRSFNAIGNPTFEVDQRNVGTAVLNPTSAWFCDRWSFAKSGTYTVNIQRVTTTPGGIVAPGTNFSLTSGYLAVTLTGQQATLGAGDYLQIFQYIEGPLWRELCSDAHSLSLLVYSSGAPLKFSIALRDGAAATKSLCKLCTISTAAWTLIPLANLPVWPSGNFSLNPGAVGYALVITLACGTTYTAPAADTWQSGNFVAAPGMDNWASKPVNTNFYIGFIQHEPGALCTTPIDCPFTQNYDDCLRYFCKSYEYPTKPATNTTVGLKAAQVGTNTGYALGTIPFPKPMAKTPPTFQFYAPDGTANAVLPLGGSNITTAAALGLSTMGIYGVTLGAGAPANTGMQFHYIADTGW